ncbi:ZIP family metal transporter [Stigmatella aurantiaca]|uniref:Metal cation transporter, zinc (Zn2+)-iron (Fe2+) permease (ZIP) family n=1 Tax=Stigmatella aurantiaca (strain DW4/3-1) TaxID=378806 RepID=Q098U1_STIAD|nr:ZIP family metal transporter [Stigmatella aurantiaca]ADO74105.1 Metal cation transporter, zinc (Zn2+)-iron (Fe2+) permease (ZIP) family [Stigmatella aurantiaca DW4/3-1]EAU68229.1 transporter, Zip family [Stigmatella aurantiaca DW4/3-1]
MSPVVAAVAAYSFVIVLGALAGALLVVFTRRPTQLVTFLAFAAGVMLGAAFFHMLPEAFHGGGYRSFTLVPAGFVFLLVLERFVLTHTCEEPLDCTEHMHHGLGFTAFIGLSVHTLVDGIALGSAVKEGVGMMAFLAITAHKVPSSLSLASILKAEGRRTGAILAYALFYGLMVPVGAALYLAFDAVLRFEKFSPWALAFSAGTFLYIAVSDLLPHVNRHGKDRRGSNLLVLGAGLLLMLALAQFAEH